MDQVLPVVMTWGDEGRPVVGSPMRPPDEITAIMALSKLGWGSRRIADELGISRTTVRRYVSAGGPIPFDASSRKSLLDEHADFLEERFFRHRGNCDVLRQELAEECGVVVSLRTVERACENLRAELRRQGEATVRFETPPGHQLQIDFGETKIDIGGERVRTHLFVATLAYSRRNFVMVLPNESQRSWFCGLEAAFAHFGGVPQEVLIDNASSLVFRHDTKLGVVTYNERFLQFCHYWSFMPRACAPRRPRTKGKDESGVRYVKRNAIAGRSFASTTALDDHLVRWTAEIADQRIHGTTFEPPRVRFLRDEASLLTPVNKPSFIGMRTLRRRVHRDGYIEVDAAFYSVPWRFIGEDVAVEVVGANLVVMTGAEVARHQRVPHKGERVTTAAHYLGLTGSHALPRGTSDLLRPLSEYGDLLEVGP